MSLSTKKRRLPQWDDTSTPSRTADEGTKCSKEESEQQQSEASTKQLDHISEKMENYKTAALSHAANNGTRKPPVQDFTKLLEGVVFAISGLANPERSELRTMALDMGAQYRPTWSHDSTLLVCAFANTPTFNQVRAAGGTIVHKDWITECYNHKKLVAIEGYIMHLGNPWRRGSDSIEQHESIVKGHEPKSGIDDSLRKLSVKKHEKVDIDKQNQSVGSMKKPPSTMDVQQWVLEDLAAILTWLEQQSEKPGEGELETVAAQGLLVCLDDAVKSLQENKGLSMVMDNWAFIPRAVKELANYEENDQAVTGHIVAEGERFKVIYESQLKKLGFGGGGGVDNGDDGTMGAKNQNKPAMQRLASHPVGEEEDVDDDATEIISDTDSRDLADFDTDDTEELDEEEIAEWKEKILKKFGLL